MTGTVDGALPITDQVLLDRLSMSAEEFDRYIAELLEKLPPRDYEPHVLARALAYPGSRPAGSFCITAGEVRPLAEMHGEERASVCKSFTEDAERQPLIAIGANGAPETLKQKFSSLGDQRDRETLVLTGWLSDFDVCAAAVPPLAGPIPATLAQSIGTKVRTSLLWVTAAQLTQLAWSELTYLLGQLSTLFGSDDLDLELETVTVFISRFGSLQLNGQPVALSAVPARSRVFEAFSQEEILNEVAPLLLGAPEQKAEGLLRAAFRDPKSVVDMAETSIRRDALAFESPTWTRFPPTA